MHQDLYDRRQVEENIRKTALEIEELLENENVDKAKYTKLMFRQLMQGLYLQL